ncbi:MAG: hypothetical protein JMN27_17580 [gamma proteobacterium endosymbiont of Lamellibrachia anaximandri]|nr:hypothetical protein [gamma proteobacterium endosymbiont of Lamellibrachia anaximandri]MBL3535619.1 hypothetical protein [gamma proteobacterium endosymbiont of Lamellibrachia anaximandri]
MIEPLLRIDEKLAKYSWPELEIVSKPVIESGQVLVIASGFEDRAWVYLDEALKNGCTGFRVIAIEYRPYYDENRKEQLESQCRSADIEPVWVVYDRCDPTGIGECVLGQIDSDASVMVDISGMSRLLIVQLLVALGRRPQGYENCNLIYAEAAEYPPSQAEFESDCAKVREADPEPAFISWGVQALAVTPELTSPSMSGQAIRLIAFPSFNRAQLRQCLDELQPTHVDIVDGVPPYDAFLWRTDAIRRWNSQAAEAIPNRVDHQTSTLYYGETLHLILRIYAAHSAFDKLVVSPTGSKMQSVAVGIAAAYLQDIQVVYPTPMAFTDTERHTVGVANYFQLSFEGVHL